MEKEDWLAEKVKYSIRLIEAYNRYMALRTNDKPFPFYNRTRAEAAQLANNKKAFSKLFRPKSELLGKEKRQLFAKLIVVYEKTLEVLAKGYGYDQWDEEFTDDDLQKGSHWFAKFQATTGGRAEFAHKCHPRIAERCSTYVEGGSCKSAEGFDWFGFWDAEDLVYLTEAEDDYLCLHREIRAASIQQTEGCFDTEKKPAALAPSTAYKKRRVDYVDGKGKMEDSEESDEDHDK